MLPMSCVIYANHDYKYLILYIVAVQSFRGQVMLTPNNGFLIATSSIRDFLCHCEGITYI